MDLKAIRGITPNLFNSLKKITSNTSRILNSKDNSSILIFTERGGEWRADGMHRISTKAHLRYVDLCLSYKLKTLV